MQVATGISVTGAYESKNGSTVQTFIASPIISNPAPRQQVSACESSSALASIWVLVDDAHFVSFVGFDRREVVIALIFTTVSLEIYFSMVKALGSERKLLIKH